MRQSERIVEQTRGRGKRRLASLLCLGLTLGRATDGWTHEPAMPPEDTGKRLVAPLPKSMPRPEGDSEAMPIDWPAVLELAFASNLEIQMASEKVREAQAQVALAQSQWMPSLKIGSTWLHHDGQIQDIPGQILNTSKSSLFGGGIAQLDFEPQKVAVDVLRAKQQVSARTGALDRATRQTLHDCSLAYVDLVAAQAGAAISVEIAALIGELVDRSEQLLKQGVGNQVDVLRNQAQYRSQRQKLLDARQNQLAASAQLVQLLNLAPGTRLFASEEKLVPVRLVDECISEGQMVERALDQGPGLTEVLALITALEQQKAKLRRLALLPTVSVNVGEGGFGGGFGNTLRSFDNRTDVGVNVYWDVLKVVGNSRARNLFESQRKQALLQHDQLTAQLAAGVIVSLNAARQAREKLQLAETEIDVAIQSYQLSHARLKAAETLSFEVLQAIGALGTARANYLAAVIEYNRAQIQLQYLVGSHATGAQAVGSDSKVSAPAKPDETPPLEPLPIQAAPNDPLPANGASPPGSTPSSTPVPVAAPAPEPVPPPRAIPTEPEAAVSPAAPRSDSVPEPAPEPRTEPVVPEPADGDRPLEAARKPAALPTSLAPRTPALKPTSADIPTVKPVSSGWMPADQKLRLKYGGRWPSER